LATIEKENDYLFIADRGTVSVNGFPDDVKVVEASTKISPIAIYEYKARTNAQSNAVLKMKIPLINETIIVPFRDLLKKDPENIPD
jgi:hypothetical protein